MTTMHTDPAAEAGRRAGIALMRADTFLAAAEHELPGLARDLRGEGRACRMASLTNLLMGLDSIARLVMELDRLGLPTISGDELEQLAASLRRLIASQEIGDWLGAADALDEGVAPLVPAWREALARSGQSLRTGQAGTGPA